MARTTSTAPAPAAAPEKVSVAHLTLLVDGRPFEGLRHAQGEAWLLLYLAQMLTRVTVARKTDDGWEPVALDRVEFDDTMFRHAIVSGLPPVNSTRASLGVVASLAADKGHRAKGRVIP